MASPLVIRSPQCISCLRRTVANLGEWPLFPAGQQIRGKKKVARAPKRVNALLMKDVKGYGKKGSVMSVAPGVMRNQWYPNKLAEYVTDARLKELGLKKEDIIERGQIQATEDAEPSTEQVDTESEATVPDPLATLDPAQEPAKLVELEPSTPEQPTAILSRILPPTIEFIRTAITKAHPAPKISPSLPAKAAISSAAAGETSQTLPDASINGSVSTADIAANIMAILAEKQEESNIVLVAKDISFVQDSGVKDGIKHLGAFEVDIRLKGAPDAVRRTVKVSAQE